MSEIQFQYNAFAIIGLNSTIFSSALESKLSVLLKYDLSFCSSKSLASEIQKFLKLLYIV